jgi:hypothetical protein
MPDTTVQCPHCEQTLEISDELIGQQIECPSCNGAIDLHVEEAEQSGTVSSCVKCGATLQEGDVICTHCGTNQQTGESVVKKSPGVESAAKVSAASSSAGRAAGTDAKALIVPGILGGLVAGVVGMFAWYFLIKVTGCEIGYAAWGLGALVGVATAKLARHGSPITGIAAALIAGVAIIGGQYFAFRAAINEYVEKQARVIYQDELAFAGEVCEARDEPSIRRVIAVINCEDGSDPDEQAVTDEEIASFDDEIRPGYEDFVNGKPSREECQDLYISLMKASISFPLMLKESVSLWTALWLFLGVGTAFKIASGKGDE